MRGQYDILVENRRMQYKFTIRRNITVLRGNSATGKTTLIEMIQEFNDNGPESGISLVCERDCVVLSGRYWQNELDAINDSIVFIDEGSRFVLSEEFAQKIKRTNNYYVIVTRNRLDNIPYSVNEIYGIRNPGKYGTLQKTYHELYRLYEDDYAHLPLSPVELIVEDSNSGYQFFHACCDDKMIDCISANGKSNIFLLAKQNMQKELLIIADGAAFGPEMNRIDSLMKVTPHIHLYLPESFEWLLLISGIIDKKAVAEILANPVDYIESKDFFSWEQFFTDVLIQAAADTIWHYQKRNLNPVYLHTGNKDKILHAAAPVLDFLKGE
ncbi:translation initiation factor 2 [Mitsuokella sp. WILCCON 0060]|uniref:translation initiation factor 2 n=1 Tax=Mitsuokella sp. WILCCON 0060 TaxID=3345341 RepID=UPI003F1E2501